MDTFLFMIRKYSHASFGFIGEPKRLPKKSYSVIEDVRATRRFQLYRNICIRDIHPDDFDLQTNGAKSAIILINNHYVSDKEKYVTMVKEMMKRNYVDFED